jgi:hypothetical protein
VDAVERGVEEKAEGRRWEDEMMDELHLPSEAPKTKADLHTTEG